MLGIRYNLKDKEVLVVKTYNEQKNIIARKPKNL